MLRIESLIGQTLDTSEWLDFEFYLLVWYWDQIMFDMITAQSRLGQWSQFYGAND